MLQETFCKFRTRTNISRSLYIYYPIFHCGLYCNPCSVKKYTKRSTILLLSLVYFFIEQMLDRLVLKTIYVLNKEILQFISPKSAVYNQDLFQIKSVYNMQAIILTFTNKFDFQDQFIQSIKVQISLKIIFYHKYGIRFVIGI